MVGIVLSVFEPSWVQVTLLSQRVSTQVYKWLPENWISRRMQQFFCPFLLRELMYTFLCLPFLLGLSILSDAQVWIKTIKPFLCLFHSALVIANTNGPYSSQDELYTEPVTDQQKRNIRAHYMGLANGNQDSSVATDSTSNPVYERFDFHEQKFLNI